MKTLIIAEKPSLAREIQSMLEASFNAKFTSKGEYVESSEFMISSFFGHLLEMCKPDQYDEKYSKWVLTDLPILPTNFIFKYKDSVIKRKNALKEISSQASLIINACDPDREGEGIFRTWYEYEHIKTPFKRFWSTSLTQTDLTKAWKNLRESKQYDTFYYSQQARAQADWLVGMNGSRLYSILTGDQCPIGRVKTAVLALVVKRDFEVETYQESFTYSLTGKWANFNFTYIDEDKNFKFDSKDKLDNLLKKISSDKFSLSSKDKEEKKTNPPKTFSMPDLQKESSRLFDFTLDETLEIVQSLYEKKLVTYPRTDSPYLPVSDLDQYFAMINRLATQEQKALLLPSGTRPPSVKNTDSPHTAIIPTGQEPSGLSDKERKIYDLIRERFIVAFMVPKFYDQYTLMISNSSETFRSIIKVTKDPGFEKYYKTQEDEEPANDIQDIASIDENFITSLSDTIKELTVNPIKKTKPKYYTEDTLLEAMINAGKTLEDKESRDILNEVEGLGTSATRHLYPKELLENGFVGKKGKYLVSISKGRKLIHMINPSLKSVEKTAELEKKLRLIQNGQINPDNFRSEIDDYVKSFVQETIANKDSIQSFFKVTRPCPKCGATMTNLKCGSCDFILYKQKGGLILSQEIIEELLTHRITPTIKGFKSKPDESGKVKTFDAKLKLDDDFLLVYDFEKDELGNCSCGGGVIESPKAFNCKDCKKTVWKEIAGKKVTKKQAVSIMQGKKVKMSGLKNKSGEAFDANVFLDEQGKIKYEHA